MSLVTPQIQPLIPFPSNVAQTITFTVGAGSSQIVGNTLNIYKLSDNTLVFSNSITSFLLQNIINANVLTNGQVYKAEIITKDINNNSSNPSDSVVFYVLSNPILYITNIINGKVYNQNVTFSCTYSQAELEPLISYIYNLYDYNQNLIQSYPNIFTDGSTPLTQLVSGLDNNILYYIQVKTISINGQMGDSELIPFTPLYISPSLFSTLTTTAIPSTGSIELNAIILQEVGNMDSGTEIYQDSTWIDLTQGGQVSFENGFQINGSEFVCKVWAKNITVNTVFLKLYTPNGRIDFKIMDNQCHAYVYLNGLTSVIPHFISNTLVINTDNVFMIYIKYLNGLMDLSLTLI